MRGVFSWNRQSAYNIIPTHNPSPCLSLPAIYFRMNSPAEGD